MKKGFFISLIVAAIVGLGHPLFAEAKGWDPVKTEQAELRHVASDAEIEIKAKRGVIHLSTGRPVNIRIYTILGSQIASDNLQPGMYQYNFPVHGVYIIKAGELTCKVAV